MIMNVNRNSLYENGANRNGRHIDCAAAFAKISPVFRKNLLIVVWCLLVFPVMAQVKRVNNCNPMSKTQSPYSEIIYEYDYVDEQPQFPGGDCALINFINKTREYPYNAYKKHIEGRVLCSFIVNPDGSVSHISVVRGANHELNREAVRIISEMPKWKAGKMDKNAVHVRCFLPIAFRL